MTRSLPPPALSLSDRPSWSLGVAEHLEAAKEREAIHAERVRAFQVLVESGAIWTMAPTEDRP